MQSLIELIAIERLGPDLFGGSVPNQDQHRIFGGAMVAQSLLAAYETVQAMTCHSLHGYFVHPGDASIPIRYEIDRLRDGKGFSTRAVAVRQNNKLLSTFMASFQIAAEGPEHQIAPSSIQAGPETLTDDDARGHSAGIQLRNSQVPRPGITAEIWPPRHQMWFRSAVQLGDDIRFHQAALAYASDFPQLPSMIQPHDLTWQTPGFQFASLDHSIWFHRPLNFNNWHSCELDTPSSSAERGFSRGTVFSQDGVLVASVAQEAMLRMRRTTAPPPAC